MNLTKNGADKTSKDVITKEVMMENEGEMTDCPGHHQNQKKARKK